LPLSYIASELQPSLPAHRCHASRFARAATKATESLPFLSTRVIQVGGLGIDVFKRVGARPKLDSRKSMRWLFVHTNREGGSS